MDLEKRLQGFKQIAQEKLQAILCSIPSQKDLIIEPSLIKPLERVCVASWIKSKGVQKIYKLDSKHAPPKQQNSQVYLIGASLPTFKLVLEQIHAHENSSTLTNLTGIKGYHVIVLPNVYNSFHVLLEEEGLYGVVTLHRFNWDFIHLDESVLSLEVPQVFSEIFIQKDTSLLPSIAHSLRVFSTLQGMPDIILSYGENSEKILNMIERLEKPSDPKQSDFSAMIIIDRNKDYPSCLLTPAIYSGLLLEVFKYRSGELDVQPDTNRISAGKLDVLKVPKSNSTKSTATTIRMNAAYDEIYAENRYKHFSEASNLVREQAKALGLHVQNINKMKIKEMKDYVEKNLPKITEMKHKITKHLNVCEQIINELAGSFQSLQSLEEDILSNTNRKQILAKIDETLTIDGHKFNTIRLMCLVHNCMTLSSDELSTFIRNYCNMFGHKHLHVFQSLAKAGLLPDISLPGKTKLLPNIQIPNFQQTEFQTNASRLKLLTATASSENPTAGELSKACPSYVFNGLYIPVVAQLAHYLLNAENINDLSLKLGMIDKLQLHLSDYTTSSAIKQIQQAVKRGEIVDRFPLKRRLLFVFVVGGITYAEISACNLIGRITGSKIVLASNCVCSGSDLVAGAF